MPNHPILNLDRPSVELQEALSTWRHAKEMADVLRHPDRQDRILFYQMASNDLASALDRMAVTPKAKKKRRTKK